MIDLLAMAERVVERALARGAASAEAFLMRERTGSARIEKNELGGIETDARSGVGIRTLAKGRVGFAYFTNLDKADAAIRDALEASRLSKPLRGFSFAARRPVPKVAGLHDAKILELGGPDAADMAAEMVRTVSSRDKKLAVTEAGVAFAAAEVAVANSEGVALHHRETSASLSCFVVQSTQGVSTGFASQHDTRWRLDPTKVGAEAADLALRARNPVKLASGGVRSLLVRPEPAADLLDTITLPALVAKSAHRDESFYSGKMGRLVAHRRFGILDDPTRPRGLGSAPFDDEGEPSRPLRPIRNGVLKEFFRDAATAAEYGGRPTGSALRIHPFDGRSYKSPPSAGGRNLRLDAPSRATDKMIASIDEGLLVHDLMGVHTANVVSGDFSVTSSLLFRIHKGAVEGPVAPLAVAGNLHEALRRGIVIGDDEKATAGDSAFLIPSVLFEGFTVTP